MAKAQLVISIGQAIAEKERYIQTLKAQGVEDKWIEAFETRKKHLEELQGRFLDTEECEEKEERED